MTHRPTDRGLTLIELMVYIGLATSMIVAIMGFEALGRKITSRQFARLNILSMASLSMDEIVHHVRGARTIQCQPREVTLEKMVQDKPVKIRFWWKEDESVLYQEIIKDGQTSTNRLSAYLKEVNFQFQGRSQSSSPHFKVRLVFFSEYLDANYSMVLERQISLP